MKILCVEDGSVNEETLQQFLENPEGCNSKVLIYRQGAKPPYVLDFGDSQDRIKIESSNIAIQELEYIKRLITNENLIKYIDERIELLKENKYE